MRRIAWKLLSAEFVKSGKYTPRSKEWIQTEKGKKESPVQPGIGKVRLPDAGWCWYDFLSVQVFLCFLWDKT